MPPTWIARVILAGAIAAAAPAVQTDKFCGAGHDADHPVSRLIQAIHFYTHREFTHVPA